MGIFGLGGLQFVGWVGIGFSECELVNFKEMLVLLYIDEFFFDVLLFVCDVKGIIYVKLVLVVEVCYSEWILEGWLC